MSNLGLPLFDVFVRARERDKEIAYIPYGDAERVLGPLAAEQADSMQLKVMKAKAKSSTAQPSLLVDSEVVRQIRQHARSYGKTEICGVLIGQDRDQRDRSCGLHRGPECRRSRRSRDFYPGHLGAHLCGEG